MSYVQGHSASKCRTGIGTQVAQVVFNFRCKNRTWGIIALGIQAAETHSCPGT